MDSGWFDEASNSQHRSPVQEEESGYINTEVSRYSFSEAHNGIVVGGAFFEQIIDELVLEIRCDDFFACTLGIRFDHMSQGRVCFAVAFQKTMSKLLVISVDIDLSVRPVIDCHTNPFCGDIFIMSY